MSEKNEEEKAFFPTKTEEQNIENVKVSVEWEMKHQQRESNRPIMSAYEESPDNPLRHPIKRALTISLFAVLALVVSMGIHDATGGNRPNVSITFLDYTNSPARGFSARFRLTNEEESPVERSRMTFELTPRKGNRKCLKKQLATMKRLEQISTRSSLITL